MVGNYTSHTIVRPESNINNLLLADNVLYCWCGEDFTTTTNKPTHNSQFYSNFFSESSQIGAQFCSGTGSCFIASGICSFWSLHYLKEPQ